MTTGLTPPSAPTFDRRTEPWCGTFPGLGTVTVSADGSVAVGVESDDALDEVRAALRFGWGELLSLARRGYGLALAASVVIPDSPPGAGALLVTGEARDVAGVILGLVDRGCLLLSDRPSPTRLQPEGLVAYPRSAPLLLSDRLAAEHQRVGVPVRTDSNAVAVDVPRSHAPSLVGAAVHVVRKRPGDAALSPLSGQQKFERAASLMMGGALAPERRMEDGDRNDPVLVIAEDVRLSRLSWAALRVDSGNDPQAIASLWEWWQGSRAQTPRDEST